LNDPNSASRKKDHIEMAFESQASALQNDKRFYYEPLLQGHSGNAAGTKQFLNKAFQTPIWISSMTGGTEQAGRINRHLAQACGEFGMGMGLGSCRRLLDDNTYFEDFNLRPIIGKSQPLFANLGIAQIETLLDANEADKIHELVSKLAADGLIIHVNPFQEWLQPEGDHFTKPPIETIQKLLELVDYQIIVKEVGQGMGPESIKALLKLPIAALDFGAYGGTNFSQLELLRSSEAHVSLYQDLAYIGHTAVEMTGFVNEAIEMLGEERKCPEVIISGGIGNFLDGYYCMQKVGLNSVYGQGSAFLKPAQKDYQTLKTFIESQREGLALCSAYLRAK
jgi:isopentenyl-diphosphate Delta-isomerase